jgi:23S rRNA (guanosine2251-2'-O)-methyltransferase
MTLREPGATGEVVYGRNPVLALLRGPERRVDEVAVLAGASGSLGEVVAVARRAGVKVSFRTRDQLTAIAGSPRHQGVVARVAAAPYADVERLLEIARERGEAGFFLAVDQVQDPRNLGAILRSADAFGAHGVIVPKHHQVGLTGAVARETNLVSALEKLKKSGIWIYGSSVAGGVPPWKADLSGPLCLVLGSEGEGLRPLVARTCDAVLTIPIAGRVGSLNVASAAAVLCYEIGRQRQGRSQKILDLTKARN